MPRKRKRGRPRRSYKTRSYQSPGLFEDLNFDLELDRKVVREILAVILVGLGLFILLATVGGAGNFGKVIFDAIRLGFGWTGFIFPLMLIGSGVAMFYPVRYNFKAANVIGLILFVASLSSLFHIFLGQDTALDFAKTGDAGGFLGFVISRFMLSSLDFWASFLILVVVFIVSLSFVFGAPLKELYMRTQFSLPKIPDFPDI